jgi:hypothetical protein
MTKRRFLFLTGAVVGIATGAFATQSRAAETASATISSTSLGGGEFQYNLNLTDTGTTNIGTYWFSWIPGVDYMEAKPTNITFPAGWSDNITGSDNASDGNAIQYLAGTGSALTPGNTDSFSFDSTETLSQLLGASSYGNKAPETTAFIYSGAPFSDGGFEFTANAVVPEPATIGLVTAGAVGLLMRRRKRA